MDRQRGSNGRNPFWAFDLLPAQIAVVDKFGTIVSTNESWRATASAGCLGDPTKAWNYLEECHASARRGCLEAAAIAQGLQDVLAGLTKSFVQTYPCAFGGRHRWYQVMIAPIEYAGAQGATVTHVDVTGLQHDALTGLANRALFEAQAVHVLEIAQCAQATACIALIDLDGFKAVNDDHGHLAGDWLLSRVARVIGGCLDEPDMVARLGGDEFGIVFGPNQSSKGPIDALRSIREALELPIDYDGARFRIGASVGVARFPEDGSTLKALIAAADRRMYGAKRRSRLRSARETAQGHDVRGTAASPSSQQSIGA